MVGRLRSPAAFDLERRRLRNYPCRLDQIVVAALEQVRADVHEHQEAAEQEEPDDEQRRDDADEDVRQNELRRTRQSRRRFARRSILTPKIASAVRIPSVATMPTISRNVGSATTRPIAVRRSLTAAEATKRRPGNVLRRSARAPVGAAGVALDRDRIEFKMITDYRTSPCRHCA